MNVVEAWFTDLRRVLNGESVPVSDVRVGVFYTAAQLSSGEVGVAFTPRDLSDTVCCPRSAQTAPSAGHLAGRNAWDLARYAFFPAPLRRAVGVAVLNALSALAIRRTGVPGGRLLPGVDAFEAAEVSPADRVAMVGAFAPLVKVLKDRVATMWVVDKHRDALKPDEVSFWRPPERGAEVLSQATVAIITGSALVEGGIDNLLAATGRARRVVVAGSTAPP